MQVVGVGVPTEACRRWDSGDHPIAEAHQSGIASNYMSPAERRRAHDNWMQASGPRSVR